MSDENKFILDIEIAPLKQQLKDAVADLQLVRQKFGEFSDEAITAAQKVATIKDEIQGAAEQANLFDPGNKFLALGTLASQAAGGIAAVQGALALIGTESEDVNKALMKVQGALALSQGLSELKDFGKSFDFIKTSIKGAIQGLNGFQRALVATGIGAAVAAIGLLIAYWDDLKDAISGTSDETRAFKSAQEDVNKAVATANARFLEVQVSMDLAKQGVISKEKALKTYNEKLGDSLGKTNSFSMAEKRIAENTDKYLKALELRTRAQVFFGKAAEAAAKAASGEDIEPGFWDTLWNSITSAGNVALFNVKQTQTAAENLVDLNEQTALFTKLANEQLKEAIALETQINAVDNTAQYEAENKAAADANNKRIQTANKNAADFQAAQLKAAQILYDAKKSLLDQQGQEEETILKKFRDNKIALEAAGIKDFTDIEKQRDKELGDVRAKYKKEETEREREFQNNLTKIQNETKLLGMEEGIEKEREMIRQQYAAQIQEIQINEKLKEDEKQKIIDELKLKEEAELQIAAEADALKQYERDLVEQDQIRMKNEGVLSVEKMILDEKQRLTEEAYQNGLLTEQEYNDKIFEYSQERQKIAETEVENRRAINAALFGLATQFGQTLQQIAGKNKKVAIAGVVIEQAAAIGQIIASTGIANAKAVAASPITGGLPWVAINTATAALSIVQTIAKARQSIQQIQSADTNPSPPSPAPPPGGGGGGGSASAPSVPAPVATIGNSPVETLGRVMNQQPQPVRAYVVESEVAANQQRVNDIRRRADLFP